jgi:ribonuclease R
MGDKLTVRLVEAVPLTGGLRFELAEGNALPRPAPSRPKITAAKRKQRR